MEGIAADGSAALSHGAIGIESEMACADSGGRRIPQGGQHLPQLDGVRGLAITLALATHCIIPPETGSIAWVVRNALSVGWLGVDLFFALSGYLITGILLRSKYHTGYFRNFYARRALRIFPLYFLILAIVLTLAPVLPFGRVGPVWPFLTYLANLWGPMHQLGILSTSAPYLPLAHSWSLAIEEQFYACLPLAVYLLDIRRLRRLLWAVVLLSPVARLGALASGLVVDTYFVTFFRLDVLAMGALVATSLHGRDDLSSADVRRGTRLWIALMAASVVLWLTRQVSFSKPVFNAVGLTIIDGGLAMLIFVAVVRESRWLDAVLRLKPVGALGRISYGVYLIHFPIVLLTRLDLPYWLPLQGWGLTFGIAAVSIGVTIVLAGASWRFLERPFLVLKGAFPTPASGQSQA